MVLIGINIKLLMCMYLANFLSALYIRMGCEGFLIVLPFI